MTFFSEADERAAGVFSRQLGEALIWRPMVRGTGGGVYTRGSTSAAPDPDRPVRTDIVGIVTWRSGLANVAPGTAGAAVATAALTVELSTDQFTDWPRQGDRLEIVAPEIPVPSNVVEITRLSPHGSQLVAYCSVVTP